MTGYCKETACSSKPTNYNFALCGGTKLAWITHNCDYGLLPFSGGIRNEKRSWSSDIPAHKSIEELSFESALRELEAIVSKLEQGEVDLEDSIALYERGQALKSHCEKKLKSAEGRLEKIVLGAGGPEIGEKLETA